MEPTRKPSAASAKHIHYRPAMDGLRGLACLIVLVGHSVMSNIPETHPFLRGVPKVGVWLFFALSAFLLTARLLETGISFRSIAYYACARFLRIIPLFAIAVAFYFAVGTLGIRNLNEAVEVLTFQKSAGHLWTIPVELGFYVVLPFLLLCTQWLSIGASIVVIALVYLAAFWAWPAWHTPENNLNIGWYLCAFIPSILAAMLVGSGRAIPDRWVGATLLAALLYILFVKIGLGGDALDDLMDKFYVFGIIFAGTVMAIYEGSGRWSRLFASRPLVVVGEASFSIYLFHWAFIHWTRALPSWIGLPVSIAVSIAVGYASCRFIEMPLYAMRKWRLPASGTLRRA
ncbi:acyltransferase family protein [Pararhizobium mangrovi]|nr:acyltransferase [Pararhizobium mangrovi]